MHVCCSGPRLGSSPVLKVSRCSQSEKAHSRAAGLLSCIMCCFSSDSLFFCFGTGRYHVWMLEDTTADYCPINLPWTSSSLGGNPAPRRVVGGSSAGQRQIHRWCRNLAQLPALAAAWAAGTTCLYQVRGGTSSTRLGLNV